MHSPEETSVHMFHDILLNGTYHIPGGLASAAAGKGFKGRLGKRMVGEGHITGELVDTLGGVLINGLLVEENIPDTRSAVLRVAITINVGVMLLRGCVRTDKGNKVIGANCLVLEEVDQSESIRLNARQETARVGLGAILASNERANTGTERAGNGSNIGAHLDQISHGDLGEAILCVVLVVDGLVVLANLLKTHVLATSELVRENDGAISTAALGSGLERPGAGIVEADADSISSPSCAAASLAPELVLQLVGNVLPDTAGITLATLRVHRRTAEVALAAGGVAVALKDLLDITAD